MDETTARRAARTLFNEHWNRARFRPLAAGFGVAALADGYDVQDRYVALLRENEGEAVGYKVGLTSTAMQAFCGIDHPVAGVVLANRVHRPGDTIPMSRYGRLGLEFEIAVRMQSDLPAAVATPEAIAPHVEGVCGAIELVDDRSADYGRSDVRSLVADNSWNAGVVLPEFVSPWPDLAAVPGTATCDGSAVGAGHGADILGHPFNSVAWLAAHLAARGQALRAGDIVMTGSVMKTVFPTAPGTYRFELAGLGSVEVDVA